MSDYIINSKNRKLKTKILLFLSRINVGAGKLPLSGRIILLMQSILTIALFFPWLELTDMYNNTTKYTAFSPYLLYVGYGVIIMLLLTPFLLISHTKKEYIRARIPFRLSDTQAVVFLSSMMFCTFFNIIIISRTVYAAQIATTSLKTGFSVAFTAIIFILISAYFYSKNDKNINTELYYIDHNTHDELDEYQNILNPATERDKKNMSLPI